VLKPKKVASITQHLGWDWAGRLMPEYGHASRISEFPLQTTAIQSMQLMEFQAQLSWWDKDFCLGVIWILPIPLI